MIDLSTLKSSADKAADQMLKATQLPKLPGGGFSTASVFPANPAAIKAAAMNTTVTSSAHYATSGKVGSAKSQISGGQGVSGGDAASLNAALLPFENVLNPITNSLTQSTNMSKHVGDVNANLPEVMGKASTIGAIRGGMSIPVAVSSLPPIPGAIGGSASDPCSTDTKAAESLLPTVTPISDNTPMSEVAGTLTGAGDKLQDDASSSTNNLMAGIPGGMLTSLDGPLDEIIAKADNAGDLGSGWVGPVVTNLNNIATTFDVTGPMLSLATVTNDAANLINACVVKERVNAGFPNVDGSALTDPLTGITIPAGDPKALVPGAGNMIKEVKEKGFALKAQSMVKDPCGAEILGRSGTPEMAAASVALQLSAEGGSGELELDTPPGDEEAQAELEAAEAKDMEVFAAEAAGEVGNIEWKNLFWKMRAMFYSTEADLSFHLSVEVLNTMTQMAGAVPRTYSASSKFSADHVETTLFGNPTLSKSMQGVHSLMVADDIFLGLMEDGLPTDIIRIWTYPSSKGNGRVTLIFGHPDLEFRVYGSITVGGEDCTTSEDGRCVYRTVQSGFPETLRAVGPSDGNDAAFYWDISRVEPNKQINDWIEAGSHPKIVDGIKQYIKENP